MTDATEIADVPDWRENAFDLTRGLAAYSQSDLFANIARVIAKHPDADIANAFNHKQVACKMWAREELFKACGGRFDKVWVLGGWYGVLAAMLFDDPRFNIQLLENIDLEASVEPVALTLNRAAGARFRAVTADMYALDYTDGKPDLAVNTSCEHIPDVRGWLDMLPRGTRVLLQSNDYFSEPTHINCVASLADFETMTGLDELLYAGELPQKKYTRFMLIGVV